MSLLSYFDLRVAIGSLIALVPVFVMTLRLELEKAAAVYAVTSLFALIICISLHLAGKWP